jgi:hypothetical protein
MARTKFLSDRLQDIEDVLKHGGNPSQFLSWLNTAINSEDFDVGLPNDDTSRKLHTLLIDRLDGSYDIDKALRFRDGVITTWRKLRPDNEQEKPSNREESQQAEEPHTSKAEQQSKRCKLEVDSFFSFSRSNPIEETLKGFKYLSADEKEEIVRDLLQQSRTKDNQIAVLKKNLEGLKVGLNKRFLQGSNKLVSIRYGKEIMLYLSMLNIAVKDAEAKNKGRQTFPLLFETNGKRLAKQFHMKEREAREALKNLEQMGAIRLINKKEHWLYIYSLGERKRVRILINGRLIPKIVDSLLFNLSRKRTKQFYKEEKHRRKHD